MAEEPRTSRPEPDLELPPLLGFGRKRKARKDRERTDPAPTPEGTATAVPGPDEDTDDPTSDPTSGTRGDDPLAADPVPTREEPARESTQEVQEGAQKPVEESRGGLAPATGVARRRPPVPPPARGGSAAVPPVSSPPPAPEPAGPPQPAEPARPAPTVPPAPSEAARQDKPAPPVAKASPFARLTGRAPATPLPSFGPRDEEETTVLPAAGREAGPVTTAPATRRRLPLRGASGDRTSTAVQTDRSDHTDQADQVPTPARGASALRMPLMNPRLAAVVAGLVVGLATVVLSFLANRGCESVRGVGSCGGLGLLALLVILAIGTALGAALLKAARVTDPTSTAVLGVGLMAVFVLLFLLGSLESAWMLLVIPVVAALAFLVSEWVTTTFVEETLDGSR